MAAPSHFQFTPETLHLTPTPSLLYIQYQINHIFISCSAAGAASPGAAPV